MEKFLVITIIKKLSKWNVNNYFQYGIQVNTISLNNMVDYLFSMLKDLININAFRKNKNIDK